MRYVWDLPITVLDAKIDSSMHKVPESVSEL
jgi:hypothetical protein